MTRTNPICDFDNVQSKALRGRTPRCPAIVVGAVLPTTSARYHCCAQKYSLRQTREPSLKIKVVDVLREDLARNLLTLWLMMEQRAQIRPSLPVATPTVSYWQDPPASIHNNPTNLPQDADFIIIGSGISGSAIAWNLIEEKEKGNINRNAKIIMLEARAAVSGATGRNGRQSNSPFHRVWFEREASTRVVLF